MIEKANCAHNTMRERKNDPKAAWECADCGYVYGAQVEPDACCKPTGYIPPGGVWTAKQRSRVHWTNDWTAEIDKARNTVAALVAALEASLRRERAMNPDDSLQGDEERDFLDERREADRLLDAVKR